MGRVASTTGLKANRVKGGISMFYHPSNPQLNLMAQVQAGSAAFGAKTQASQDKQRKAAQQRQDYANMAFNDLLEVMPTTKKEGQFA